MKTLISTLAVTAALAALSVPASAAISYPDVGSYNPTSYTFKVAHNGNVDLFFAGASAGNDNTIGVSVDGTQVTSGLFDDHTTSVGTMYKLTGLTKGETVVFTLDTNGTIFSSNSSANVGLDGTDPVNDNHIWADEYHHYQAGPGLPKSGLFLGFEDEPLTSSDRDFNDETFVATNLRISNPCGGVPEPATWTAMLVGFAGIGFAMRKKLLPGLTSATA